MLKKRAEVLHAQGRGRLIYPILDIFSKALSNDRGYRRSLFGKGQCHAATGSGQQSRLQTKLPRVAQAIGLGFVRD